MILRLLAVTVQLKDIISNITEKSTHWLMTADGDLRTSFLAGDLLTFFCLKISGRGIG